MLTLSVKSTNDYRRINGSGAWFCTLENPSSRKYKSFTKYQRFRRSAFVLWRSGRHESTNDLRSFNGSSTCLLYFADTAFMKVQMIHEVSTAPALGFCTLAAQQSRKYKSLTKFQWFQRSPFVLWRFLPRGKGRIPVCAPNNSQYVEAPQILPQHNASAGFLMKS